MGPQGNTKGKGETILKTVSTEIEKNHKLSFRRLSSGLPRGGVAGSGAPVGAKIDPVGSKSRNRAIHPLKSIKITFK